MINAFSRTTRRTLGQINTLNQELLIQLHESGIAVPSSTMLNGKFALRVAITNLRSRQKDFEILVRHVISLGKKLMMDKSGEAWLQAHCESFKLNLPTIN